MNRLVFNIFDINGDGELTIVDFNLLQKYINPLSRLGKQVDTLFQFYINKKIKAKNARESIQFDFSLFNSLVQSYLLFEDLKAAMVTRIVDENEVKEFI